jgi:hypothetical protein
MQDRLFSKPPIIGFIGTRTGMTSEQYLSVLQLMEKFRPDCVHHGDSIGSAAQMHAICQRVRIDVEIHPSIDENTRAFCEDCSFLHPAKESSLRNRDIVDAAEIVLAAPKESEEQQDSETWDAIRYAREGFNSWRKRLLFVYPDGRISG